MAVTQHETTIAEAADRLSKELPGHRVEILQGRLTVTPPADGRHARTLTRLTVAFHEAGAEKAGLEFLQGIGIWLPTGEDDYAVPDFSLVEADFLDHKVTKNCYRPDVFRMILEVTSSNWADDTGTKVESYARADVPVYVIADRHHDEVVIYADPRGTSYRSRRSFKRGTTLHLPDHLGVTVELSVDMLLD
ncbi:Uma2 family endonuclease [Streptomyces sp. NBC_00503]|uniref:Uma2 family endonuclease n=1 Tax=Streptomyces sp. NBC_00503 TaxID=2903659 RepID=UPI002E80DFD6|nr:Uma2 family endonuclease [Streptomyces sp. NBC_00503]WUD82921.1 Uma2 family endonuclease [Streptomyces sp. NBC_00503]